MTSTKHCRTRAERIALVKARCEENPSAVRRIVKIVGDNPEHAGRAIGIFRSHCPQVAKAIVEDYVERGRAGPLMVTGGVAYDAVVEELGIRLRRLKNQKWAEKVIGILKAAPGV